MQFHKMLSSRLVILGQQEGSRGATLKHVSTASLMS